MSGLNKRNVLQRAEFESAFTHSSFKLLKMSTSCKYHYAIQIEDCGDEWLPITFLIPDAQSRFSYLDSVPAGVIILWVSSRDIGILEAPTGKRYTCINKVVNGSVCQTVAMSELVAYLTNPYNCEDLLLDKKRIVETITHGRDHLPRTQETEATATNHFITLFEGTFTKTGENCLADGCYGPIRPTTPKVLPLQLKSSINESTKWDFQFGTAKTYDDMLMILRHIPSKHNIVAPGNLLKVKGVVGRWEGKYAPFVVEDSEIVQLVEDVYNARLNGRNTAIWPNSKDPIDISSIKLETCELVKTAQTANYQKEQHFAGLRRAKFPSLTYTDPPHEAHTIDLNINDVAVQDKTAGEAKTWWQVNIYKHGSYKNGKLTKQPYAEGDFDALYIHVPGDKLFYLVPSTALVEKGFLKSEKHLGKQTICFYPFGNEGGRANLWLNDYLHSYDDEGIEQQVIEILADIKANRE